MDINYVPQQFNDGQTLEARHLNYIEEGIKNLEQTIHNLPTIKAEQKTLTINGTTYDGSEEVSVDTREFVFNVTVLDYESGECEIDVTAEEFLNAYNSGRTMVCMYDGYIRLPLATKEDGQFSFLLTTTGTACTLCTVIVVNDLITAMVKEFFGSITINDKTFDGTEEVDFTVTINNMIDDKLSSEPLIGTTAEITPTQVAEALSKGREIALTHVDTEYGICCCNNFSYAVDFDAILSSAIVQYSGNYMLIALYGNITTNSWTSFATKIATLNDVPTDEHINRMIDEKLGVIENAAY